MGGECFYHFKTLKQSNNFEYSPSVSPVSGTAEASMELVFECLFAKEFTRVLRKRRRKVVLSIRVLETRDSHGTECFTIPKTLKPSNNFE
jgi:hypothetical protein